VAATNFQLLITEGALAQLRALPKELRRRIGEKLMMLESGFQ
jgi:mRNA-degrading endonuclease RelE of RelBE toxin-antitoxin system